MNFLVFAAVVLAVFFIWGILWPRSQWRVLVSWTRRNPEATEPGPGAFAAHRILSGVAVLTLIAVGVSTGIAYVGSLPEAERPRTALQQMWGNAPEPVLIDRVVQGSQVPDAALAEATVLGYQVFDNTTHRPRYLVYLEEYVPPAGGAHLLGVEPSTGFAALDSAELVVHLRLKPQCTPMGAVVVETEEIVQVTIRVGLEPVGAEIADHSFCEGGSTVGPSVLIPINLASPIGERQVQTAEGDAIPEVEVINP